jgi:hypothetical protein
MTRRAPCYAGGVPRRVRVCATLLLGLAFGCSSAGPPPPPPPRDWSEPVDFTALRAEYGSRDDFSAVCEDERPFAQLAEQARTKDWNNMIATTGVWLESCPIDIDAHFFRAVALKEVGRNEESDLHVEWYKGLVESVLASGDGRTPQSAWVVISVPEEYSILRAMRVKRVGQKLVDGHIDALEVERRDGQHITVYFDPRAHFERLRRRLQDADAEGPGAKDRGATQKK